MKLRHFLSVAMALTACVMVTTLSACGGDDDAPISPPVNPEPGNNGGSDTPTGTLQLMQTCSTCNGSKNCTTCNGTGKGCQTCKGKGVHCSRCGDSGECTWCYGSKKCSSCYGKGGESCSWCLSKPGYCGKCVDCTGTGEMKLQSLSFTESGGNEQIFIHGSAEWTVSADVEWIRFSRISGSGESTMTITVDANNTATERTGSITFAYGSSKVPIKVSQVGETVKLEVEPSSIFVNANGAGESIVITSNTSWTIKTSDSWFTCSPSSGNGNTTVTVNASAYTGTRYTTLTITDVTGEVSREVSVAQASSPEELMTLKNWLEKPMGVVDVNMKTAAYNGIRNAVAQSFTIGFEATGSYPQFVVYAIQNASFADMKYQGLQLTTFEVMKFKYFLSVAYRFEIEKSKVSNGYEFYLNKFINDFKYTLGITLEKDDSYSRETYKGVDADGKEYSVSVGDTRIWNGSEYVDGYSFSFGAYY